MNKISDFLLLPYTLVKSQDADPLSFPLRVVKAGRNHLNEEIATLLLAAWIGER
jgi:hypothetical protein